MSGIAGILAPNQEKLIHKMLSKIKYRGTSQPQIWTNMHTTMGTIGLKAVFQKRGLSSTPSDTGAIVFDGRLTNRKKLRKILKSHDMQHEASSEVVLHGFEENKMKIFEMIDGEFALGLANNDQLVLARDRLGIRPLYIGFYEGNLCFASEIKALIGLVDKIHEFPPGHFLISDMGLFPYNPYLPEEIDLENAGESANQLVDVLDDSVKEAIPKNIDIGVWLSGGVDSSVLASLSRPYVDQLYTFSAGMKGAPDLKFAREVADHIEAQHHERIYTEKDMEKVLEKVIYLLESFDAPLVRSTIANYLVAELAADYVPYVLSGEGGDELFAGYDYQKECDSGVELMLSVQDSIAALHNTALQRVDRSAAAHGTYAAVPYLHPDVVRYALAVPSKWKIKGPKAVEKWPLRKGLSDRLPDSIIWRKKVKFWQGAGAAHAMEDMAESKISDSEFESERIVGPNFLIKSKEELHYYRIFKSFFRDNVPLDEVGRTEHI